MMMIQVTTLSSRMATSISESSIKNSPACCGAFRRPVEHRQWRERRVSLGPARRYPVLMLSFLALALAAAAPHPSEIKLFKDWVVGCDNGRFCQAVGLMPEGQPEDAATMTVERGPEAEARPVIRFAIDAAGAKALAADGKRLEVRLVPDEEGARVVAADVPAAIAALRSASRLVVLGAKGENLGS